MERTYINVPYSQNSAAKALGAKWDPAQRSMYVPSGLDVTPFARWSPKPAFTADLKDQNAATVAPPSFTALAAKPVKDSEPQRLDVADEELDVVAAPIQEVVETVAKVLAPVLEVKKGITLSNLLSGVAAAVASAFKQGLWTTVEVAAVNSRNGHFYLELAERDANGALIAKANGTIWAATAKKLLPEFERATGAKLAPGIKLLLRAKPVYKTQFGFSLDIDAIDSDYTLGDLEARKREIRSRLASEGLFDAQKKLPAPWDYNCVLVIAPDAAAGLGDFQAQSNRLAEFGVCHFMYAQSRFQGEGAASEITSVLRAAMLNWGKIPGVKNAAPDAVVIIRGGGAVNDLAWLNDYGLCRSICELKVPVLTGIGHERDSTLIDEVAYAAFDTPSKVIAGIEKVIVKRAQNTVDAFEAITNTARMVTQKIRASVDRLNVDARSGASRQVEMARLKTADLRKSVKDGSLNVISIARNQSKTNIDFVAERSVSHILRVRVQVAASAEMMKQGALQIIHEARGRTKGLIREITGQGPEKTLVRGFSVVRDDNGKPITRAEQITAGQQLSVQFLDGFVQTHVQSINEKEEKIT